MDKNRRIYVAGHAGLIGSAVLRRLEKDGFRDVLVRGRGELELTDPQAVGSFFRQNKPEYVVLAAGKVGGIMENKTKPADFLTQNLAIELNVLSAARAHGVKRLLFFGSSCMYPRQCTQPMKEEMLLSGSLEPTSMAYAAAKIAGVEMCLAFNRQDGGTRFIPMIPNSVYGPNDDFELESSHVLSAILRRFHEAKEKKLPSVTLWGSGNPRREFVYADDVADACLRLLDIDVSKVELPINIGVGRDVSIRELAELIKDVVGFEGRIEWDTGKPDGAPAKLLDSSRILSTGWKPLMPLRRGLEQTYRWYVTQSAPPLSRRSPAKPSARATRSRSG